MKNKPFALLPVSSALFISAHQAIAQGTAFTFQGRLHDGGNPASGIYDLRFAILQRHQPILVFR